MPHGSRKIEDCQILYEINYSKSKIYKQVKMVCHDQETLDHRDYLKKIDSDFEIVGTPYPVLNCISKTSNAQYHDHILLLHSEMGSQDLEWFEQHGSIGVYWWCHAIIAKDWFRYAEIDPNLSKSKTSKNDFLIYNRAWSGLREYRIKFTELILDYNLQDRCQMTFNPEDSGKYWSQHTFANSKFAPKRKDLDQHFCSTNATASASADYVSADYIQTAIEVVLETVFDDTKWHLTEKILRPIACGHPFILVSTPGSLQYLKRYGFQTFEKYIDEGYDDIQDPVQRLEAVVKLMSALANLPDKEKQQLYANLVPICNYNKSRFFSKEFVKQVIDEFQTNFDHGFSFIQQADSHKYFERGFEGAVKLKKYFTGLLK